MMRTGGIEKDLVIQMFKALPADAAIVGFGEDTSYGNCYVLVTSKHFKEISEGYRPSDITAMLRTEWSESYGHRAVFDRLDMSEALEQNTCCKPWQMKKYTGLTGLDSYNYCDVCGKKETK